MVMIAYSYLLSCNTVCHGILHSSLGVVLRQFLSLLASPLYLLFRNSCVRNAPTNSMCLCQANKQTNFSNAPL